MKKILFSLTLCLANLYAFAQNEIEWSPNVQLTLEDFQSPSTEINPAFNSVSLSGGSSLSFAIAMSSLEFMLTKNFNSKVSCVFYKNTAMVVAPDTANAMQLVNFEMYCFNLSELYARKMRRKLHEEKRVFSNLSYFEPIYNSYQLSLNSRKTATQKLTEFGAKADLLAQENGRVLAEIETLADFCKTCTPPKKKK